MFAGGLRRVAVYVDEAGGRHELSATCPHLGGVVSWNSAEKSWDCPCHGSRFDCAGKVISGPAVSGLERMAEGEALSRDSLPVARTRRQCRSKLSPTRRVGREMGRRPGTCGSCTTLRLCAA